MEYGNSELVAAVAERMGTIAGNARHQGFRLGVQPGIGDVHKTSASYITARSETRSPGDALEAGEGGSHTRYEVQPRCILLRHFAGHQWYSAR